MIQILCGRDIAVNSVSKSRDKELIFNFSAQMRNFVYVVTYPVDDATNAIVIDCSWDVSGLKTFLRDKYGVKRIEKALYTHRHFDHCGGVLPKFMTGGRSGVRVEGVKEIREDGTQVFVGKKDVSGMARQSGLKESEINTLEDGMRVAVGNEIAHIDVIETPGHTPGSCCFRLSKPKCNEGILFTGDTLFVGSCGRSDLPESDPRHLLHSLTRLSKLPESDIVLPGHHYAYTNRSTMGTEVETNTMIHQALRFSRKKLSRSETSCSRLETSCSEQYKLPNYVETCRNVFSGGVSFPFRCFCSIPLASDTMCKF